MATQEEIRHRKEQVKVFESLRDRTFVLLERFAEADFQPHRSEGDFLVYGDFTGCQQVVAFVHNVKMLQPRVIEALQQLIKEFPGWEIEVTVAFHGHYEDWPNVDWPRMGLYIRPHEIIDGLQRQYFPKEFQSVEYPGARRGTADD
jgi:hypothetical protein